ncbi:G2-specific serine/threonine protein kinase [Orbilia javanica]|uniref:non-specific serine/threonine protein kinase n=1 Tax=Orbilia javanica TaxID=47235 RepID=A0AAN8NKK9_9PEZI
MDQNSGAPISYGPYRRSGGALRPSEVVGFAPFSWGLSGPSPIENSRPQIPQEVPNRQQPSSTLESEPQELSDIPVSSSPPSALVQAYLAAGLETIKLSTPSPGGQRPRKRNKHSSAFYSLPGSYEKDFKVRRGIGAGSFGEVAIVQVISAEDGGIAHGFRLRPGMSLVAKKISTNPLKERTIYSTEWHILDILRGHRNILHAICTQQPRVTNPYGHIFMEYCDLGDLAGLVTKYRDAFRDRLRSHGLWRVMLPKEVRWLELPPNGIAYEIMTSVARGLAWMQYGVWDWPLDSAIDPDWTPIMHNDIKIDNVLLVSRQQGDECPYPIFKIGDFGAATKLGSVAFIGNSATASPERVKGCLRIPSVPEDDVFSLGAMMYSIANDVYPYEFDNSPRAHIIVRGPDETFETIPCPNSCSRADIKHFKGPYWTTKELPQTSGVCQELPHATVITKTEVKYPPPYARWWHNLVDDCIEFERQDRPHIIEVLERLYLGRRGRREDNIGNPLILWDPFWLSEEARNNLKSREHEIDAMWKEAMA